MKNTTLCYIEYNGKYLMLYRNKKENDLNEGKWVGIGGKFEEGETPDECLLREALEETGLTLLEYKLRGLIRFSSDIWGEEFMFLYSATEFSGKLQECDEGEFSWIDKKSVSELPIWEGDKAIFRALLTEEEFFIMEVIYRGDELVNEPVCIPSPIGELFKMQDKEFRDFQAKLIPTIDKTTMIGVRTPMLRKFGKTFGKAPGSKAFIDTLPHFFYEENLLHGILISEEKDYEACISYLDRFLPYVDNWAVCDLIVPKVFKKNKDKLIVKIKEWIKLDHVYTGRFGLKMLMTHFLDEDYKTEYLSLASSGLSEDYYGKMMVAWFFATALAKQWDDALLYLKEEKLEIWIHNKTIQKAVESYRITPERKDILKSMRRKTKQVSY